VHVSMEMDSLMSADYKLNSDITMAKYQFNIVRGFVAKPPTDRCMNSLCHH
jgi:hypothetical protein